MKETPGQRKLRLLEQRGYKCENCGTETSNIYEAHHCLFHRMKGRPELDEDFNIMLICRACHVFANSYGFRCLFWEKQVIRYGIEEMVQWYVGVRIADKPRFWEKDSETAIYMKGLKGCN